MNYISIPSQGGDSRLGPSTDDLRKLYDRVCQSPYCAAVDEICVIVRIDSIAWPFKFMWPERLRYAKARRYVSVEVGIIDEEWEEEPYELIKGTVYQRTYLGLVMCIDRLIRAGEQVDVARFLRDAELVRTAYLGSGDAGMSE